MFVRYWTKADNGGFWPGMVMPSSSDISCHQPPTKIKFNQFAQSFCLRSRQIRTENNCFQCEGPHRAGSPSSPIFACMELTDGGTHVRHFSDSPHWSDFGSVRL